MAGISKNIFAAVIVLDSPKELRYAICPFGASQLAFPQDREVPPEFSEGRIVFPISLSRRFNFRLPKFDVGLRYTAPTLCALMSMPETAVDKDNLAA